MSDHSEYEALEKLAKAASPGPWRSDWRNTNHFEITSDAPSGSYWVVQPGHNCCDSTAPRWDAAGHDLDFIAAANPTTVLALLAEIRRLRETIGTMHPEFEDERVGYVSIQVDRSLWLECRSDK